MYHTRGLKYICTLTHLYPNVYNSDKKNAEFELIMCFVLTKIWVWIIKTTSFDGISQQKRWQQNENSRQELKKKVRMNTTPTHKHTHTQKHMYATELQNILFRTAINNAVKSFYHLIFIQQSKWRRVKQMRDRRVERKWKREREMEWEKNSRKKQTSDVEKTQRNRKQCMIWWTGGKKER